MSQRPLTVAWISYFPFEWLDGLPDEFRSLPRQHPASWQRVLLAELEKRPDVRLHVFVLHKHFSRSQQFERNGVTFHLIKTFGGLRASSFYWLDTFLLRRELEAIQPDLIHAWGTEKGAALVAGRTEFPYIVTMQGLLNWIGEMVPMSRYDRLAAFLEDFALQGANLVTAESSFAMDYLYKRHPHLDLHQVEHAPLPLFCEVVRAPVLQPLRLLFVGHLSHLKGVDTLLEALAMLPSGLEFELRCVGSMDEAFVRLLQSTTPETLWRRIRFLGSRNAAEIAAELAAAALFVYPTRCDNSPNAVKEAVVAGVPVVASSVGGIVDYVEPGRNGLLFSPGDGAGLARCLRQAMEHPLLGTGQVDPDCLSRMRYYLSPARMAEKFMSVYRLAAARQAERLGC